MLGENIIYIHASRWLPKPKPNRHEIVRMPDWYFFPLIQNIFCHFSVAMGNFLIKLRDWIFASHT